MKIIKPPRLKKGDVVGIVSPSNSISTELQNQFERGITALGDLGLQVKMGANVMAQNFYRAGTAEQRLSDLHELWRDPSVKMILMSQGGCAANHLLDRLDYDLFRTNPKLFVGISDGTTLLNAVSARTGLVTFHGPDLLWCFGRDISSNIWEHMEKTFFGEPIGKLVPSPNWRRFEGEQVPYRGWKCIRAGRASGELVGGHLASLIQIGFSGYGADFNGKILFLEGTEAELPFSDKALNALRLHGAFEQASGIILGWFDRIEGGPNCGMSVADLLLEATKESQIPILEIGELGHNVENYVFPIGSKATIDCENLFLSFDEISVS